MSRTWIAGVIVALAAFSSGCCMCSAPYDYCGPTYTGCDDVPCLIDERVGSAFNGWYDAEQAGYEEEVHEQPETNAPAPTTQPPTRPSQPNDYYDRDTLPELPPRTTQRSYQGSYSPRVGRANSSRSASGQNFRLMDMF